MEVEHKKKDDHLNIFVSCQQTQGAFRVLQRLVSPRISPELATVKLSSPRYNMEDWTVTNHHLLEWASFFSDRSPPRYDITCFGVLIARSIVKLFSHPMFDADRGRINKLLEYAMDTFVQTKVAKIMPLVNELSNRGLNDAVAKISKFLVAFPVLKLDDIKNEQDWCTFLKEVGIPDGWETKLHFDHVLGLFGVDAVTAQQVRETKFQDKNETVTLEQYSLRWLSKAIGAYKIVGCLTDVVNLIYAMLKIDPNVKQTELDVCNTIETFGVWLSNGNFKSHMWIPDVIIHDNEKDDALCVILCRALNAKLEEYVQIPADHPQVQDVLKHFPHGFVDSKSTNKKNFLNL